MTDERKAEWARKALGTGIIIILLLPLFVAKGFLLPFNSGKVLIFRAVVDVLLAPTVWLILSAGWPKIVFHPLTLFWGLFLAVRIAAGAAGLDPFQSFWGELNRAEGLLTEIHVWLFLLVVITAFVSGFREEIALGVSVGGALLVFADALLLEKAKWVFLGVISQRSSGTIGSPSFFGDIGCSGRRFLFYRFAPPCFRQTSARFLGRRPGFFGGHYWFFPRRALATFATDRIVTGGRIFD